MKMRSYKMKYKIVIIISLFVLIGSPFIYGQVMEEDFEDTYIEDMYDRDKIRLTDILLMNSIQKLLGDRIEFVLGDYALYGEYDMFGNLIMRGQIYLDFSRRRENDKILDSYAYRVGGNSTVILRNARDNIELRVLGVQFITGAWKHNVTAGYRIKMRFTPYTFKKLNLFGIRYDFSKGEAFKFTTFFTPKFNVIPNRPPDISSRDRTYDSFDYILTANRIRVDLGNLFGNLPSIFDGQKLGTTFIYKSLSNGAKSWRGYFREFMIQYKNLYEQFKASDYVINGAKMSEAFNRYEYLAGADISGKLATFKYRAEYVYNERDDYWITEKDEFGVGVETANEDYSAHVVTGALSSDDILNKRMKNLLFSFNIKGWFVDRNFGAEWANDDDDDKDKFLDENKFFYDYFYPWERSDNKHLDEPTEGVIPEIYNENMNGIVDYKEDFLLFYSDRGFVQSIFFEDVNYNNVHDVFEDDYSPDFPYDRDRTGFHWTTGITPFSAGILFVGGIYNWVVSDKDITTKAIIAGYNYARNNLFNMFDIRLEYAFEKVKDYIRDDFVSKLDYNELLEDRLLNSNNLINKILASISFVMVEDLTLEFKIRRTLNNALDREFKHRYLIDIFKVGYDLKLFKNKMFTISPQYKYERYRNMYFGRGNTELFITDNKFINQTKEDYIMNVVLFRLKLDILDSLYLISGVQYKMLKDFYLQENVYNGFVVPAQLVIKGRKYSEGRFKTGKTALIGLTIGYKYEYKKYSNSEIYRESMFYIRVIIPL